MLTKEILCRNVENWMHRLSFPEDARDTFRYALDRIFADTSAYVVFLEILQRYEDSVGADYMQMLTDSKALGEKLQIHEYTISMLLPLCMAETLRRRYCQRGISQEILNDSMQDLRYKLEECRLVYGINGSFVAPWFYRFFNLTRFALGRLQFEVNETKLDYTVDGILFPAGSKAINVHIPRTGTRLEHGEVLQAYRQAADMFRDAFGDQPILFTCYSWLLDPWNLTVLPPASNLAAFCRDYQLVDTGYYENYAELWRLFDCVTTGDPAKLPQDSTLRRAYVSRMLRGEKTGWGRGFFRYIMDSDG